MTRASRLRPAATEEIGAFVRALSEARARTLLLVAPLDADDLGRQHDPLMSPIVWDLGHIAEFERLWLVGNLEGTAEFRDIHGMYDPFRNPRATRDRLPLPERGELLRRLAEVRWEVLETLDRPDLDPPEELLRDGFVFHLVLQHEYQHNETILQTLQLKRGTPYRAPRGLAPPAPPEPALEDMVRFPGGRVEIGVSDRPDAYDNERPAHMRELPPFWIDRVPVTNGAYRAFVEAGGYERRELWSEPGWRWLEEEEDRPGAPKYWYRRDGEWWSRVMDRDAPVDPAAPVCHVCWHEAEAYARFAGKRLPTEFEWEAAATWDPAEGRKLAYPWGDEPPDARRANLDQLTFGVAPVGAYPTNRSPIGCYGMIGDVWEWTASAFGGYPGFRAYPYREYSEVFFGDEYRVLRGGSWATRPGAIRGTFRNWDYPIRRQIFAGFRCARDD